MDKLINRIQWFTSFDTKYTSLSFEMHVKLLGQTCNLTSIQTLPGKLDIIRHLPSFLYLFPDKISDIAIWSASELHWTKVLSSHFSISFFLTKPWWYCNNFLTKYVYCNELKLSGVLEEFSITSRFLGSKMQKSNFWRNKRFECSFYQIQV